MRLGFELTNIRQLKNRCNEGLLEAVLNWTLFADMINICALFKTFCSLKRHPSNNSDNLFFKMFMSKDRA